jgi:hypothetical protein
MTWLSSKVLSEGVRHRCGELLCRWECEVSEPGSFGQSTFEGPCVKDFGDGLGCVGFPVRPWIDDIIRTISTYFVVFSETPNAKYIYTYIYPKSQRNAHEKYRLYHRSLLALLSGLVGSLTQRRRSEQNSHRWGRLA